MGNPEEYRGNMLDLNVGIDYDMRNILRRLVDLQFDRNDAVLGRGQFRVRGDTIEVHPSYEETVLRIEMFGDTIDRLTIIDPITGETLREQPPRAGVPGHPLRRRRRADAAGRWSRSRRNCRSGWPGSRPRASCSRPSDCACARSTTWR